MFGESIGTYFRVTTNGTMRTYRSNLMHSRGRLNDGMTKVMTHRAFNSYAEDPAKASKAFQLRRGIWRIQDQVANVQTLVGYNQMAWTALDAVCDGDSEHPGINGFRETLAAISDTTASGKQALGQSLLAQSESIVMNMNVRYGDRFVFGGSDGLNVPFEWEGDVLKYRGVDVSCGYPEEIPDINDTDSAVQKKLSEMFPKKDDNGKVIPGAIDKIAYDQAVYEHDENLKLQKYMDERGYVDIGLGMKEKDGEFLPATGYDGLHQGIKYIGYGRDADGDSKNIAVIMRELGNILQRCDRDSGKWASGADEERAVALAEKLRTRIQEVSEQHVRLSAETTFLQNTEKNLNQNNDLLDEARENTEGIDPAAAITEMAWADYCYKAALQIGQRVLSQSLLDYMS